MSGQVDPHRKRLGANLAHKRSQVLVFGLLVGIQTTFCVELLLTIRTVVVCLAGMCLLYVFV